MSEAELRLVTEAAWVSRKGPDHPPHLQPPQHRVRKLDEPTGLLRSGRW